MSLKKKVSFKIKECDLKKKVILNKKLCLQTRKHDIKMESVILNKKV